MNLTAVYKTYLIGRASPGTRNELVRTNQTCEAIVKLRVLRTSGGEHEHRWKLHMQSKPNSSFIGFKVCLTQVQSQWVHSRRLIPSLAWTTGILAEYSKPRPGNWWAIDGHLLLQFSTGWCCRCSSYLNVSRAISQCNFGIPIWNQICSYSNQIQTWFERGGDALHSGQTPQHNELPSSSKSDQPEAPQ